MATVNIGSLKFNWKGAYNGSTAYAIDDVTEYNGSSYICILASTGNLPTNTTYFQPMATKGTDGTDVGTTLTTQGDILYRDGSGLQRLAAGTNGQVLLTGGSGANPSWGTLSSDWVKLHTVNHSGSNVSSYAFDGHFDDTTYASYRYIGYHRTATGQNSSSPHSIMRYNINGTENSAGDYNWAWQSGYYNGSAGDQNRGNHNDSSVRMLNTWGEHVRQDTALNFELDIQDPQSTTLHCTTIWKSGMSYTGNEIVAGLGAMNHEGTNYDSNTKVTGFTFRYENGNQFNLAYGTLYGLKR